MSLKLTATSVGNATAEDAKIFDIVTTLFSSDQAVTGTYGFIQKGALFLAGMSAQNKRVNNNWNPFGDKKPDATPVPA